MPQSPSSISSAIAEIKRKKTLGASIELCAELGGFALDKQLAGELGADKGQFSRWTNGTEGILYPKLRRLMDVCGNHVPVLWQLHDCGYDLASVRRSENETERQNRELLEENAALRRALMRAGASS